MIDIDVSKIVSEIGEPMARLIENEDEKRQRKTIMVSSIVFLFLFICGLVTFFILSNQAKAAAEISSAQVGSIEANNAYLLENEQIAREVVRRNQSIKSILENNASWSYVFEKLEEVVPRGITFNKFDVASQSDMQISGTSTDYVELSKLVVSMNNSGYFGGVDLVSASLSPNDNTGEQLVEFTIAFSFTSQITKQELKNSQPASSTQPIIPPAQETLPVNTQTPTNPGLPTQEEGITESQDTTQETLPENTTTNNGLPVL